jgi:general secretion pathway protein I
LLRATTPPIDGYDAGFTIIEVLIALAVVAVSILAIGSVMSTSLRGVRVMEQHVTLTETARAVMAAELPPRARLGFGSLAGKTNGLPWRIDVSPLGEEWLAASADATWIPALVRIEVRAPSGAVSDLKTVRLVQRRTK